MFMSHCSYSFGYLGVHKGVKTDRGWIGDHGDRKLRFSTSGIALPITSTRTTQTTPAGWLQTPGRT